MLPARSFYMIRHGETVMNARRLTCGGGVDTELNQEGRRQAMVAAQVLETLPQEERPTLIIQSGMSRTRETTAILNQTLKLPVLEDNALREHMMGEWEQKKWEDILPLLWSPDNLKPEGGESRSEFACRVREALAKHLNDHAQERLMFVGHGGTFHSFQFMHGITNALFIPNATLHHFTPEPAHTPMPWRIKMFEWRESLRVGPANICPSQTEKAA